MEPREGFILLAVFEDFTGEARVGRSVLFPRAEPEHRGPGWGGSGAVGVAISAP